MWSIPLSGPLYGHHNLTGGGGVFFLIFGGEGSTFFGSGSFSGSGFLILTGGAIFTTGLGGVFLRGAIHVRYSSLMTGSYMSISFLAMLY